MSNESSAADKRHRRACARTTGAGKGPWTVEISTTAASAPSAARPRSMRLLARIARRAFRPDVPRARQGFFVVSNSAAGAAGLREQHGGANQKCSPERGGQNPKSKCILHHRGHFQRTTCRCGRRGSRRLLLQLSAGNNHNCNEGAPSLLHCVLGINGRAHLSAPASPTASLMVATISSLAIS